jgi:hypothetical protein
LVVGVLCFFPTAPAIHSLFVFATLPLLASRLSMAFFYTLRGDFHPLISPTFIQFSLTCQTNINTFLFVVIVSQSVQASRRHVIHYYCQPPRRGASLPCRSFSTSRRQEGRGFLLLTSLFFSFHRFIN